MNTCRSNHDCALPTVCDPCDKQCAGTGGVIELTRCLNSCKASGGCDKPDLPTGCDPCNQQCAGVSGVQEKARCLNSCKASGGCDAPSICGPCKETCKSFTDKMDKARCENACNGNGGCNKSPSSNGTETTTPILTCEPCINKCASSTEDSAKSKCITDCNECNGAPKDYVFPFGSAKNTTAPGGNGSSSSATHVVSQLVGLTLMLAVKLLL